MFSDPENNIKQLNLASGMLVADFGSGSGFYTLAVAKEIGEEGKVFAVDIQKDLLERLKTEARQKRLSNIEVIWGDLERLGGTKLQERSLDAVVASNLFFQITNKDALCLEIKRVLKRNARVLIIDWSSSFGSLGPIAKDIIPKEQMISLFENHGFSLDKEISVGANHYGLIFRNNS